MAFYCIIKGGTKNEKIKSVISQTKSLFTILLGTETLGLKLRSYVCILKAGVK